MNASDFDKYVVANWRTRMNDYGKPENPLRDEYIMTAGLGGKTGEVLELLKKNVRDGVLDKNRLALELGDVLHYLTRIATWHGFSLEEIMDMNVYKLEKRRLNKNQQELTS